jgi:hypothetical protein
MTRKRQAINLSELRPGFRGKPFCQLIRHHLRQQRQDQRIQSLHATVATLPEEAHGLVEAFIDRWNVRVYDKDFWQSDTASVFDEITRDARDGLFGAGLAADDDTLFNMFRAYPSRPAAL